MLVVALSEEMAVDEDADSHHSKNCNADSVVEYIKFHYSSSMLPIKMPKRKHKEASANIGKEAGVWKSTDMKPPTDVSRKT